MAVKKLIEVALPLEKINAESAREKSIRHGHPSTLHLWWARRPLAAARAVIWSSLVDDPSSEVNSSILEGMISRQRKNRTGSASGFLRFWKIWLCGKTPTTRMFWMPLKPKS